MTATVINKYPPGEVARVLLVVLNFTLGVYVLWRIQEVLFLLFIPILLATAIEPIVNRLRRGPFTRGSGVLVVYTAIMLVISVAGYLVVRNVLAEASSFGQSVPEHLQSLRAQVSGLGQASVRNVLLGLVDQANRFVQSAAQPAIGIMAGIGYTVIGLPNAALLAVAAGLFELGPTLGPVLAFAPAVLVALTIDPSKALMVIVYALVIQQIESNVLVPRVMRETVGVSPLTVLLGILIGAALYGLPGAFLAVPVAGAVQVLLAHALRSEDASQAEEHPDSRERLEQQSAPSTAAGAGRCGARNRISSHAQANRG